VSEGGGGVCVCVWVGGGGGCVLKVVDGVETQVPVVDLVVGLHAVPPTLTTVWALARLVREVRLLLQVPVSTITRSSENTSKTRFDGRVHILTTN
jgi:hypothetical protein